ncbi:translin-associated factor X-interacting protein 1 [Lissotriton helveticus]
MALPPLSQPRLTPLSGPCNFHTPDEDLKPNCNLKRSLPLGEYFSGHLSTWPAYGSGQTILEKRKPCTVPDPTIQSNYRPATSISKPRFLEQLENYLKRELQCLDQTGESGQEAKLQPYREVFEYFIEEFKTYKPLLSAIKNEYELTLAHQREQIRSLEPLKSMLVTVSERCDLKIQEMREAERLEVKTLRKEKLTLLKQIDKLKTNLSFLKTQVAKLQKEVGKQYHHFRNELDARRLLISDINELKLQRDDVKQSHSHHEVATEDSAVLALALKVARSDLAKTQVELDTIKANYGDVVPRRDYEAIKKNYSEISSKAEVLQSDFDNLKKEHEMLLELNSQLLQQRDEFCTNLAQLERSSTPRPHWVKCAEVLPGGYDNWITVSEGRNSDELVDLLLSELGWRILKEKDFFEGMGTGLGVPVHLRQDDPVKNLMLTHKDVVNLLKEVWREKNMADQETKTRSSLPEFFLNYLEKKFDDATTAMEWSYSVHETCRMHRTDEYLYLFYSILMGEVDEDVYHGLVSIPNMLLKLLTDADPEQLGTVTRQQFSDSLRESFPLKSKEQIQELIDTADVQLKATEDSIAYQALIPEDEEWKSGTFMGILRSQRLAEKKQYLKDLRNELWKLKEVQVDDLRTAITAVDHYIDFPLMETYIAKAFKVPAEQLDVAFPLPLEKIMQHLEAEDIRRAEPPRAQLSESMASIY